jgi:superfamily I DNA/RNA helicase
MRAKEMHIRPGYDGEYGIVTIFDSQERTRMLGQKPLFDAPAPEAEAGTVSPRAGRPAGFQLSEAPSAPAPAEKRPLETVVRLNEDQRKAVLHAAARLMILAGPGTGKTHTLTCRIAHLITDGQAEPHHILAVTFTHKAAEEMRQRLQAMGSGRAPMPCIATFHSLCLSLLQEANPNDVVALVDESEQTELVAEALERAVASGCPPALRPPVLQARIVRAKQHLIPPDHGAPSQALPPEEACFRAVYQAYQRLLEGQGQLDFEDLIFRVVNRLESDPQFLAMCRIRFRHIFVDEYQDLNHGQYRLIRALAPTQGGGGSLCVIGDPDQSIYGFRGSDSSYFRRFIEDYPGAGVVTLTRNYRSTETILSASRQVLAREDGGRARIYSNIAGVRTISIRELPNEHAEVEAIARIIESLVGATGFHSIDTGRVKDAQGIDGCGYGDVAVLVRTNQQLRFLAEGLKASGIPFQAANRRYLLNRKGVVELIALLKLLSGVGGYADAARVAERMAPALGRKTLRTFKQWGLENRLAVKDALAAVPRFPIPGLSRGRQVQFSDFAARLAGLSRETAGLTPVEILCRLKGIPEIAQLLDADDSREGMRLITAHAEAAGSGPKELLDRLALQSDTDVYHPRAEKTALMTMHSAKGLEFPVVVIAGCETGFIPFQRESREPVDVDEERRLFYVAMTRSRERLYLTYAKRRRVFGRTENRELSVFVKDIAAGLLKHESARSKPGRPKAYQQPLF